MPTLEEIVKEEQPSKLTDAVSAIVNEEIAELKAETGFTRWAQWSAASSMIGLAQTAEDLGLPISVDETEALYYRDMATVAGEDNPIISLAGGLTGATLDLAAGGLIGGAIKGLGKLTSTLGAQGWNNLFTQGLAGGAIGGFLEPILAEEDSVATNVALGTAFGGVLGGGAMALQKALQGTGVPLPTQQAEQQLALPAPTQPVALLPGPPSGRITFQPGVAGKPPLAGGALPVRSETTGLPTAYVAPNKPAVIPGQPIPQPLGLPRPVTHTVSDSLEALGQVRSRLLSLVDDAPDKSSVVKAQVKVKQSKGKIEAWKNRKPSKELDAKIKAEERKIQKEQPILQRHARSQQARKELVRLDNGQISPIVLDRVANVAKETKKTKAEIIEQRPVFEKPSVEPTAPPNVQTAKEILGRRTQQGGSTGAAEVNPATAMIDQQVIDAIPTRNTQAKEVQGNVPGQGGRIFTNAEERRRKMYQNEEEVGRQYFFEPEDLLNKGYSFKNVEEAASVLQRDVEDMINEGNFKDAGDWLIKTFNNSRTKTLTPVEQVVASRIFAIASTNLNKLMPMFRKMSKTGELGSAEGVRMADDLQTTRELMNLMRQLERIDEASRKNISNALRTYKLANQYQKKHQRELMEGKIINDLFFGVKCG